VALPGVSASAANAALNPVIAKVLHETFIAFVCFCPLV
jgi:hypothetical protein